MSNDIKKSGVYGIFGQKYGNKLINQLTGCCGNGLDCCEIIEITKQNFLNLVSDSQLSPNSLYNIIDIDGFANVYINTTSTSTFSTNASGNILVPNYTISGSNLGQLNANNIQTVADGEKVIWADHYWVNNSGGSVTPTIIDEYILDTPMMQLSKSIINDYLKLPCSLNIDSNLQIYEIIIPFNGNTWFVPSGLIYPIPAWIYFPISLGSYSQSQTIINCVDSNGAIGDIKNNTDEAGQFKENVGNIRNITFNGNGNEFKNNVAEGTSGINTIVLVNTSRFNNNNVSGASYDLAAIGFIELWDNCEVVGNTIIGDSAIWDIRTGEECSVNNNTLDCGISDTPLFTVGTIQDIDQMYHDEINGNNLLARGANIAMIHQFGDSKLNNNELSGEDTYIRRIRQTKSELNNCILSSNNKYISDLELRNSKIENANDIIISNCELSQVNLNLTGFTVDIIGETIESGKGWFTFSHDFNTDPLSDSTNKLYNLIPSGARITKVVVIPNSVTGTGGAELSAGLEVDDTTYALNAVAIGALTNTVISTISNPAIANRSFQISAPNGDITGGSITFQIEFVL